MERKYFRQSLFFLNLCALAAILTIASFSSCKEDDNTRDIRDYYYPLKALTEGQVYEYRPLNQDSLTPSYWYYRSFLTPEGKFLTGTYYEENLIPQQFIKEEMIHNGMLLEEIKLLTQDSAGQEIQIPVEILSGSVYPFAVRDSGGIFLYKIQWDYPIDPPTSTTLIKNRRYLGDTTITIDAKQYDCVAFEVRELLEQDQEGYFEQEFKGMEFYAKGIGLIYYKKEITKEISLEYQLADRYPMTTLEEKFRKILEQSESR